MGKRWRERGEALTLGLFYGMGKGSLPKQREGEEQRLI